MRRLWRKGFTLLEILIVLAILGIAFGPFTFMTKKLQQAYEKSIRRSNERAALEGVVYRVQALLLSHSDGKIRPDNRGVTWLGGGVFWKDGSIYVAGKNGEQKLASNITHFSLHRRDDHTYLSVAQKVPDFREDLRFLVRVEKLDS